MLSWLGLLEKQIRVSLINVTETKVIYNQFVYYRGKYGMRERLVNEDDYYSTNDVRYFGVSFIISKLYN